MRVIWLILPVMLFTLNASYYLPFISDDALISLRYSQRFAQGQGLTWNDGERVEGYSNFLWVILTSALMRLGLSGVLSVRILGMICSASFLALVFFHYRREPLPVHFPMLCASLSAPLAIWAVGGLEQPLVLLLLALSIPALWKSKDKDTVSAWIAASVPLALLVVTRPDGILFTASALAGILYCRGGRKSCWILLLPVLFFAGQMIFRLAYYGDYLPNTARIKLQPSPALVLSGLKYLAKGGIILFPLVITSLSGIPGALRNRDTRILLPGAMALGWVCYLVIIGGDIMPGLRQILPLLALLTWMSSETLSLHSDRLKGKAIVAGMSVLPVFIFLQFACESSRAAAGENWEWDGMVTAMLLRDAFEDEQPLIAVTAAGTIPYWTEFPCVDMLGLNDRFLAMNQGPCDENCMVWHSICNPDYILSRAPDIISFNAAGDTTGLPIARALLASGEFNENYIRVLVTGSRPYSRTGVLWFNRRSPITGFCAVGDSLVIPAWLFNEYEHTVSSVSNGVFGITVSPERPAAIVLSEPESLGSYVSTSAVGCCCTIERLDNGNMLVELSASESIFVSEIILVPAI